MSRILIVGETWVTYAVHTKGFDSFTTASFGEGYSYLKAALEAAGHTVDVIENHDAAQVFPDSEEGLRPYATVILSDIGANTLLLTPPTWTGGQPTANRLDVIARYVRGGGGLIMVGGYLTFMGIEGKGFWRRTPVEAVLPVMLHPHDDRREHPEGVVARADRPGHPILAGVEGAWPALLGYNQVVLKDGAELVASIAGDPLIATATADRGRTAVFTSDCSPHWCPTAFCRDWPGYGRLWANLVGWTSGA